MISKSVENALEKLRLTTQSRLDQLQFECAPYLANDYVEFEEYTYSCNHQSNQIILEGVPVVAQWK